MKSHENGSPHSRFDTAEAQSTLSRHMLVYRDEFIVPGYTGALVEKINGSNFNHVNHVMDAIGHPELPLIVRSNPNVDLQSKTSYFLSVIRKSTGEYLDDKEIEENMVWVATFGKDGSLVEVSTHFTDEQALLVFDHAQELSKLRLLDEVSAN